MSLAFVWFLAVFLLHANSTLLACVGCTYISCFWCLNSAMCSQFGDFAIGYHFAGSEFSRIWSRILDF